MCQPKGQIEVPRLTNRGWSPNTTASQMGTEPLAFSKGECHRNPHDGAMFLGQVLRDLTSRLKWCFFLKGDHSNIAQIFRFVNYHIFFANLCLISNHVEALIETAAAFCGHFFQGIECNCPWLCQYGLASRPTTYLFGGFHKWGTPIAGWFSSWKIPSFEMDDDWGYPYDFGNHHLSTDGFTFFLQRSTLEF